MLALDEKHKFTGDLLLFYFIKYAFKSTGSPFRHSYLH